MERSFKVNMWIRQRSVEMGRPGSGTSWMKDKRSTGAKEKISNKEVNIP